MEICFLISMAVIIRIFKICQEVAVIYKDS